MCPSRVTESFSLDEHRMVTASPVVIAECFISPTAQESPLADRLVIVDFNRKWPATLPGAQHQDFVHGSSIRWSATRTTPDMAVTSSLLHYDSEVAAFWC